MSKIMRERSKNNWWEGLGLVSSWFCISLPKKRLKPKKKLGGLKPRVLMILYRMTHDKWAWALRAFGFDWPGMRRIDVWNPSYKDVNLNIVIKLKQILMCIYIYRRTRIIFVFVITYCVGATLVCSLHLDRVGVDGLYVPFLWWHFCWHLNVKNYHRAPPLFYRFSFSLMWRELIWRVNCDSCPRVLSAYYPFYQAANPKIHMPSSTELDPLPFTLSPCIRYMHHHPCELLHHWLSGYTSCVHGTHHWPLSFNRWTMHRVFK